MSSQNSDSNGFSLFVGVLLCLAFVTAGVLLLGRTETAAALVFLSAGALVAALLLWGREGDREAEALASIPTRGSSLFTALESKGPVIRESSKDSVEPVASLPSKDSPPKDSPPKAVAEPVGKKDDLKKIEGIGPKIAGLLHDDGILTFSQLAASKVDRLQAILDRAGSRYKLAVPETWPEQAELASAGRWDDLSTLQGQLKGGRRA